MVTKYSMRASLKIYLPLLKSYTSLITSANLFKGKTARQAIRKSSDGHASRNTLRT